MEIDRQIIPYMKISPTNIWKEFIFQGHLFAAGAIGVVYMSSILCNIPIGLDFIVAIYMMFYAIYFYDYIQGANEDRITNPERSDYINNQNKNNDFIFPLYAAILAMGSIYILWSDIMNMVIGFAILVLGVLYHSYFKKLTKFIPAFKNIYVATVWALLVFVLLNYYSYPVTNTAILISFFIFLKVLSIQILFDIRDIEGDKKKGLLTLPIFIGGKYSIVLNILNVLNFFTIAIFAYGIFTNIIPAISIMILVIFFYEFSYINQIRKEKNVTENYMMAACEPILWALLIQSGNLCVNFLQTSSNLLN